VGVRERLDRAAVEWTRRALARLGPDDALKLANGLLDTVDEVSASRWEAAKERAASLPGDIRPEKLEALTRSMARELGTAGAAAGAAAAAPMVGTGATLAATFTELAWFTGRAGDLVLTIAALHGRDDPSVDERRAWVLAVLIYGSSARDGFARAVKEATTGTAAAADGRIPVATLQMANRVMARALARPYGTRRGILALGRLIPIGIGAAVGGTTNYLAVRKLSGHADRFFAKLPYSAIEVDATDITDRQLGPLDE
jgi:hypothetical protein